MGRGFGRWRGAAAQVGGATQPLPSARVRPFQLGSQRALLHTVACCRRALPALQLRDLVRRLHNGAGCSLHPLLPRYDWPGKAGEHKLPRMGRGAAACAPATGSTPADARRAGDWQTTARVLPCRRCTASGRLWLTRFGARQRARQGNAFVLAWVGSPFRVRPEPGPHRVPHQQPSPPETVPWACCCRWVFWLACAAALSAVLDGFDDAHPHGGVPRPRVAAACAFSWLTWQALGRGRGGGG